MGGFMEVSITDCQTSYCSVYGHEWKIVKAIPFQDNESFCREAGEEKTGKTVGFSYGNKGQIWMTESKECRTKMNARVSFISKTYEKGTICGYGTFEELGLTGNFITYISFEEENDAGWVKGMFIISGDKILLHGIDSLYSI